MGKRPRGKCALCRKECELIFEHILPKIAFNSAPVKPVSGYKVMKDDERMPWEIAGLHYINQQQGMECFAQLIIFKMKEWRICEILFCTKQR